MMNKEGVSRMDLLWQLGWVEKNATILGQRCYVG
jgi:hypothetical protein